MAIAGRRKRSFRREAIRPTTPGCQRALAVIMHRRPFAAADLRLGLGVGLLQHLRLDRLAFLVQPLELGGDALAFRRIVARQQPRAEPASPIRPPALMRGPRMKPRS